jgi:hypothetical protein
MEAIPAGSSDHRPRRLQCEIENSDYLVAGQTSSDWPEKATVGCFQVKNHKSEQIPTSKMKTSILYLETVAERSNPPNKNSFIYRQVPSILTSLAKKVRVFRAFSALIECY